ncbi:MAG: DUF3035 domain-containing protein [Alphaproteobacteria bacterium]|nr:DUF3035 domain-containing protein [Alphaproteobacteria bacterium]
MRDDNRSPLIIFRSGSLLALSLILAGALSGCGKDSRVGSILGFEKSAPDEFAVVKRAPLALPPDYGLRPPQIGAQRPQAVSARDDAKGSLLSSEGRSSKPKSSLRRTVRERARTQQQGRSGSEVALLKQSGALGVDPSIRQTVNQESAGAIDSDSSGLVDKLLFWKDSKSSGNKVDSTIIDPKGEARRIQENAALGKPANSGRTPVIRRKE